MYRSTIVVLFMCGALHHTTGQLISKAPLNPADRSVYGIDISHSNQVTNWTRASAIKEIKFAFAKATEGKSYLDPTFDSAWTQFVKAGIVPGAYHFYRLDNTVEENFENVRKNLLQRISFTKEHLLAVKFESNYDHREPREVATDLFRFLQMVESEIGFKPFIHTSAQFWRENIASFHMEYPFYSYSLWIAQYGSSNPDLPIDTWADYVIWQFTNSAQVAGVEGQVGCSLWKNPPNELFTLRGE